MQTHNLFASRAAMSGKHNNKDPNILNVIFFTLRKNSLRIYKFNAEQEFQKISHEYYSEKAGRKIIRLMSKVVYFHKLGNLFIVYVA